MKIRVIASSTQSGGVSRLLSEYRPQAELVSLTANEVTFRRLALVWGVTPVMMPLAATTEELLERMETTLLERQLVKPGDSVVITMSLPIGAGIQNNVLKIHQIL
jgi:pyruvate kinase